MHGVGRKGLQHRCLPRHLLWGLSMKSVLHLLFFRVVSDRPKTSQALQRVRQVRLVRRSGVISSTAAQPLETRGSHQLELLGGVFEGPLRSELPNENYWTEDKKSEDENEKKGRGPPKQIINKRKQKIEGRDLEREKQDQAMQQSIPPVQYSESQTLPNPVNRISISRSTKAPMATKLPVTRINI
ncbi:uncharacterized protein BO72DRAFT_494352 [Aspergillus fijiensis CBS 313.89]|uniref:Uncharacterized protein n=1 Tax=Aspergillus fijiensis CBS 313.89 TaxID=1448319 RepID=A0A8G1W051_9EURO|nr:uncharacterized protein BO72DRAFT_494352 [Aspergillus fijiensis CBS 313.89]RAK79500.1 hypothetical protein BO72DRAFT_494352 [Aspergillus fijiensis CBS 313.89]